MTQTADSHEMHQHPLHGRQVYAYAKEQKNSYLFQDNEGNKMTVQERQPSEPRKYQENRNNALLPEETGRKKI